MSHSIRDVIKFTVILTLFLFLCSTTTFVFAETNQKNIESSKQNEDTVIFKDTVKNENQLQYKQSMSGGDIFWLFIRVTFALALVVGLIYLLIRFLSRKSRNFDSNRRLRIIAGIGLSPQKSLQIVEIGNKLYVIGVGNDIRVLDKIENPDEVQSLTEMLDSPLIEQQFIESWKEKFSNMFKKKIVTSEELDIEEYEKLFTEHLQDANNRQNSVENWMDENKERSDK